ncbi:hypothetical protein DOY81_014154 [Sarcophaga bullata]|nr:hypothetical protein DOY81_014154 [Sarcophaga bullata]
MQRWANCRQSTLVTTTINRNSNNTTMLINQKQQPNNKWNTCAKSKDFPKN